MKKYFIIISFLACTFFTFKQTEVKAKFQKISIDTTTSDTVRFFRNLVQHQQKYQEQPFSVLLKDIPYSIKYYYPLLGGTLSVTDGIIISFLDNRKTNDADKDYNKIAIVNIVWKKEVSAQDIQQMKSKNTYGWGDAEVKYFSPLIVDTIILTMPDPNIKN